jgi:hypothetical protein
MTRTPAERALERLQMNIANAFLNNQRDPIWLVT